MELLYKVEPKEGGLIVRLEERGSKRILYLDTLKAIAKESDKEPLALLIKLQLRANRNPETVTFQKIEVPPSHRAEAIRLMEKTGRMSGALAAKEAAVIKPLVVWPRLILTDSSGSFANLWMVYETETLLFSDFAPTVRGLPRLKTEEAQWEKDLLEAGYQRKIVGESHYYCPTEKVAESLQLLLGVGWQIVDARGHKVHPLTLSEEGTRIAIRGAGAVRGLIDPKIQMEGVWEGETFYLRRNRLAAAALLLAAATWQESLRRLTENLSSLSLPEAPPAPSFRGKLFPYQQKGVNWLHFLYHYGFSGLLADEMGLGKTVQVLAFLSRLGTNLPVLIVAPTSLLFNWRREIDRFLSERPAIELISYTTLRLNEQRYAQTLYEAIILDESNAIKTATTQTARAAYQLKAKCKVCLSGTPMENRFDELWSQFHFLMPDLLERNTPVEIAKRTIRPFFLRRRKEEVQIELPEKIEQITWIEMDDAERELYNTYKKGIKLDGLTRMEMLEAILRLRQICSDSRLIGASLPSSKFEQISSDLKEALAQGRKVLVYSQFTSFLALVHERFPEALYLDGSTSAERRGELVRQFQEDPTATLFLLSLKAGGVGLNLTAADTVLLCDPWWNEAVERQAIDRAHRIGQKKTVLAKRYLTVGTIEEKMLQLKRQKQEAADQLLDGGGESWSEEDLLRLLT